MNEKDSEMVEGRGAHRTGWFASAWFPCAIAVVLRHEPQNEQALAIWRQFDDPKWMLPTKRGRK